MKTLLATILLFAATSVAAVEHLDVIKVKIKPECSVAEYVAITEDFNENWGKAHGYHAWVAVPIQSEDLYTVWWMARLPMQPPGARPGIPGATHSLIRSRLKPSCGRAFRPAPRTWAAGGMICTESPPVTSCLSGIGGPGPPIFIRRTCFK